MRTPGNLPMITAPPQQERKPDGKKVSKLDRQALQTLYRLHADVLPSAVAAVRQAEQLSERLKGVEKVVEDARRVLADVRSEIERVQTLEGRMRRSYQAWAREFVGWTDVARKLGVKHDLCLKKIAKHGE